MKELEKDANDIVLDTKSNDIIQKVLPRYHKWSSQCATFNGKEAFKAQKELERCCVASSTPISFIPSSRYLPTTPSNIHVWKLDRKVKNTLRRIIESRLKSQAEKSSKDGYGYDVLGLTIESLEPTVNKDSPKLNMDEIIEECKTLFLSGQETTSNLLTRTSFMLSVHQERQERLRQVVLKECGLGIPNA
ncbi:unnamed protein product [Dovyalis caffra]|uniref:Cytochrome P450 n=1 Tax=Dovyalis caffra TaxID=77055 RepID=A0AAV1SE38_9ROSI|nr:unnamed protein product [Dovyalis caffra]